MAGIFISYRRDDARAYAGRLYDHLAQHFGASDVFMDIDPDRLRPGVDWASVIHYEVESCDVLIAVIGRRWLKIEDGDGRRRLANPNDVLRSEIRVALRNGAYVVPVLVEGAAMPQPGELPEDLSKLAQLQAQNVHDDAFDYAVSKLVEAIKAAKEERRRERGTKAKLKLEEDRRLEIAAKANEAEEKRRLEEDRRLEHKAQAEEKRQLELEKRLERQGRAKRVLPIVWRARILCLSCAFVAILQAIDVASNWRVGLSIWLEIAAAIGAVWVFLQLWGISGFDNNREGTARRYSPWLSGFLTCGYIAAGVVNRNAPAQWVMYAVFTLVTAASAGVLQAFSTTRPLYAEQSSLP